MKEIGMTMREICGYSKENEIICGDEKCEICYDREWIKDHLDVKELIIKNMGGKPDKAHPDIVKKTRAVERKQKILLKKSKKIYDNMLKDLKHDIIKLNEIKYLSNKLNYDLSRWEKNYPICNRVWGIGDDPTIKLKDYDFEIEELQDDLITDINQIHKTIKDLEEAD